MEITGCLCKGTANGALLPMPVTSELPGQLHTPAIHDLATYKAGKVALEVGHGWFGGS